jgi:hypothetical protein
MRKLHSLYSPHYIPIQKEVKAVFIFHKTCHNINMTESGEGSPYSEELAQRRQAICDSALGDEQKAEVLANLEVALALEKSELAAWITALQPHNETDVSIPPMPNYVIARLPELQQECDAYKLTLGAIPVLSGIPPLEVLINDPSQLPYDQLSFSPAYLLTLQPQRERFWNRFRRTPATVEPPPMSNPRWCGVELLHYPEPGQGYERSPLGDILLPDGKGRFGRDPRQLTDEMARLSRVSRDLIYKLPRGSDLELLYARYPDIGSNTPIALEWMRNTKGGYPYAFVQCAAGTSVPHPDDLPPIGFRVIADFREPLPEVRL